ncbi:MAG: hypothetical protein Q9210_006061, partial [Variospora velana]
MPSTLSSNHLAQNIYLPPLLSIGAPVLGDRKASSTGEHLHNNPHHFVPADIRHGLRTPPGDMSGVSVNPLLAPSFGGSQYKSVPCNGGPRHGSVGSMVDSRSINKTQQPQISYHNRSRSHEKCSTETNGLKDSSSRSQNLIGESSIVSYLQIPSSINESKGSLAEFAAQITCLFWFESSFTLLYVEECKVTPTPIEPLVSEALPTMGFRKWVVSILSTTQVSQNVILLALMFIYRLKKLNPGVKGKLGSEFRLFTVALMLGNKCKFWKYFEASSKAPIDAPPKVFNPPGDDNTFGGFPEHLRALVSHALPKITVKAVTYPQFETRGDLGELQNVVIDLEVSAGTPSPTVDPSVRTILVGHSMGGLVAAETLLHILSDEPIAPTKPASDPAPSSAAHTNSSSTSTSHPTTNPSMTKHSDLLTSDPHAFMFPYVQGILAFDTPYLGLSPSLIAHGAESHYRSASSAYSAISDIAGTFGWGASTKSAPGAKQRSQPQAALPAVPEHAKDVLSASMTASNDDAAAIPTWQRLGKYAMFAGAAGAVAAGGAAAYLKKDALSSGWNWVGSHLEFVGCLMRGEELKTRLDRVVALEKEKGVGFADLYTVLGKAPAGNGGAGGERRTFCNVPRSKKIGA